MSDKFPIPLTQTHIENVIEAISPGGQLQDYALFAASFANEATKVTFCATDGTERKIVIRRYAIFGNYDLGEKAIREFKALQLLQRHQIPAPTPLLLDATGELIGSPGMVSAFVAGQQLILPVDVDAWINALAATLARIHAIAINEQQIDFLLNAREEVTWFLNQGKVTEAAHPDGPVVWQLVHDHLPHIQAVSPALVHVDYWLGNVLWQDGRVTAVLDLEEAAYGDPAYDVAYLRTELAMLGGISLADQFLHAYEATAGHHVSHLAFWDLVAAPRFMPDPEGMIPEWQTFSDQQWCADAVKQNFSNFIHNASKRLQLSKEYE